ncbi:hypothetical protein INT46_004178 [Mucor plumbeus]|uniref:RRM domain-containing protein n=1 Tax=Mucor plumbeus TaxID=97098 RepID=A0A8H7RTG2_9FUNG|nr:hypothetical protein INT46_004178 [Mucor plumbeus]
MPSDKKKDSAKEEVHYAAEEYAVNDYVAPSEYTVPQGYYNENGEYVEDSSNYYSNATGDEVATTTTTTTTTTAAAAAVAQQGYDYSDPNNQYYADNSQYYYGYDYATGTYNDPNATATDASAAYNYDQYYSQNYYNNSAAGGGGLVPESVAALQSAATSSYGSNNATPAPKVYYPSTANSNNPIGPIIITKSGYTGPQTSSPAPTSTLTTTNNTKNDNPDSKKKKKHNIVRAAGGEVWEDNSLEDWDDNDFRLFAGDLGNEVTEELLYKAFSKYPSLLRTRVVRDNRTMKSKGFGFISFKDPDDFVKAWREMNGKYVGNRPIKLRKSTWKERNIDVRAKKERDRVGPYPKHR